MRTLFLAIAAVTALAGCTTTQEIKRPGGVTEYLIACGATSGWDVCYRKANKMCPQGYETVSEKGGFNRKEMRVQCPAPDAEDS